MFDLDRGVILSEYRVSWISLMLMPLVGGFLILKALNLKHLSPNLHNILATVPL